MRYYLNGEAINEAQAERAIRAAAANMGYTRDSWGDAWDARKESEECRELLNELSDYQLELIL